jgi:hypothetical protein
MYLGTQGVCDNHNAVWSGTPAVVSAKTMFDDTIDLISKVRQTQEKETKGVTEDKGQAKEAAIVKAVSVSAATFAYASVTNNNTLKEQVNYSPTELRRSRDTILADRLRVILNAANDNAAALVDYGVQAADLTDLDTLVTAYENILEAPRTAIGERSSARIQLEELFDTADSILKDQLDKLMEIFKSTAPDFYNQYKSARVIVDLGRRSADSDEPTPPSE